MSNDLETKKISPMTILHRIVYLFVGFLILIVSIASVYWGISNLSMFASSPLLVSFLFAAGVLLFIPAVLVIKGASSYDHEDHMEKQKKFEIESKRAAYEAMLESRKNNPILVQSINISNTSLILFGLGFLSSGLLWYTSKESLLLWIAAFFSFFFFIFAFTKNMEGLRVTELEKSLIDICVFLSHAFKWICIIGVLLLIASTLIGWLSALPATTIIIILLILILFTRQ